MKALFFILFLTFVTSSCALLGPGDDDVNKRKANLRIKIGSSHFQNKKFHSALKEYLSANDLNPSSPVILNNLGITYFALDRLPLAEQYIREALKVEPKYTEARLNLAKVQIELGLYANALENLKICENDLTYPQTDKINYHMGLALFKMEQFPMAEEKFRAAMKKNPDHCLATFFYGRSLFEGKSYQAASESLDSSIKLCEKYNIDGAHFYSALSHYKLNNLNTSASRLQELLELFPKTKHAKDAQDMLKLLK